MRSTDMIAVLDPVKEEIVWAMVGAWKMQHEPTALDNGNLLLLDNQGPDRNHKRSTVLELNPSSGTISWRYNGDASDPFYTQTCGALARLKNGNTLITESDNGRVFEVDAKGSIVWQYLNPHRAGPGDELVATIFELLRFDRTYVADWLPSAATRQR